MRSINSSGAAGNIKMRGKKSVRFDCGCCDAYNFKDDHTNLVAKREIKEYQHDTKTTEPICEACTVSQSGCS